MFPTPTPMPPAAAPLIDIPLESYSMWEAAPYAINWWNSFDSNFTQAIQIAIVVMILIFSVVILATYVQMMMNEDEK